MRFYVSLFSLGSSDEVLSLLRRSSLMRIGRWSELSVDSVCQKHEVMRDADASETSGVFGSALGGTLVGCPS